MIFVEAKRRQIDAIRAQFRNQQYRVEAATQVPGTPPQQFVDFFRYFSWVAFTLPK